MRYIAGFVWATFSGLMGYRYGPNLVLADLFPDETIRRSVRAFSITMNGLLPMLIFGVLMGANIVKNPSPIQEILSVLLALLLPATMARAYYIYVQRKDQQALASMQALLLSSDIVEEVDVVTVLPPAITGSTIASLGQAHSVSSTELDVEYSKEGLSFS